MITGDYTKIQFPFFGLEINPPMGFPLFNFDILKFHYFN